TRAVTMPNSIFISYRRGDSQHATFAIADPLSWGFGAAEGFFDRGSIRGGGGGEELLGHGVKAAKGVVGMVGNRWLKTADKWGRRRIDNSDDWVRREILTALEAHKEQRTTIVPVLLEETPRLRRDAFDADLKRIAAFEPMPLRADHWEAGLEALIV